MTHALRTESSYTGLDEQLSIPDRQAQVYQACASELMRSHTDIFLDTFITIHWAFIPFREHRLNYIRELRFRVQASGLVGLEPGQVKYSL